MSTFVTGGDGESTSSAGNLKADDKGRVGNSWEYQAQGLFCKEGANVPAGHIKMTQTVEQSVEEKPQEQLR